MVTKTRQLIKKLRKSQFSKSLVFFHKTGLFKTPVKPPILRNLKCLMFFLLLVQEKHIQIEILKIRSLIGNFWVKCNYFRLLLQKQYSKSSFQRNSIVMFLIEGQSH